MNLLHSAGDCLLIGFMIVLFVGPIFTVAGRK
jgi:hypothetical protein